jgi:hypothetical protein
MTSKVGRFLKFVKTPLILRKIFQNMAAKSGSLLLKVGEFTCKDQTDQMDMHVAASRQCGLTARWYRLTNGS